MPALYFDGVGHGYIWISLLPLQTLEQRQCPEHPFKLSHTQSKRCSKPHAFNDIRLQPSFLWSAIGGTRYKSDCVDHPRLCHILPSLVVLENDSEHQKFRAKGSANRFCFTIYSVTHGKIVSRPNVIAPVLSNREEYRKIDRERCPEHE